MPWPAILLNEERTALSCGKESEDACRGTLATRPWHNMHYECPKPNEASRGNANSPLRVLTLTILTISPHGLLAVRQAASSPRQPVVHSPHGNIPQQPRWVFARWRNPGLQHHHTLFDYLEEPLDSEQAPKHLFRNSQSLQSSSPAVAVARMIALHSGAVCAASVAQIHLWLDPFQPEHM